MKKRSACKINKTMCQYSKLFFVFIKRCSLVQYAFKINLCWGNNSYKHMYKQMYVVSKTKMELSMYNVHFLNIWSCKNIMYLIMYFYLNGFKIKFQDKMTILEFTWQCREELQLKFICESNKKVFPIIYVNFTFLNYMPNTT